MFNRYNFNHPYGIVFDHTGQNLYVAEYRGHILSKIHCVTLPFGWGATTKFINTVSPVIDNNACTYLVAQTENTFSNYIYKSTPGGFMYPIAGWNDTGTVVYTNSNTLANSTGFKQINSIALAPTGECNGQG